MKSFFFLAENLKSETKRLLEEYKNLQNLQYGEVAVELVRYNSMNDQKSLYSTLGIGKKHALKITSLLRYFEFLLYDIYPHKEELVTDRILPPINCIILSLLFS